MKSTQKSKSFFQESVDRFSAVCDSLYYDHGVLTLEALKKHALFSQYWLASFDLARAMVLSPVFHARIRFLNEQLACTDDDMIQEITCLFLHKYNAIMSAVSRNPNHNHKQYTSSIVSSFLKDLYKKITYKPKPEANDTQAENRIKYTFSSLNSTIMENDGQEVCFIDLLQSNDPTPEENYISRIEKNFSPHTILQWMQIAASHKSKGEVMSLILYGLEGEGLGRSTKKMAQKLYSAGSDNFILIYRNELLKYNKSVLHLSYTELLPFLYNNLEDFGHIDFRSPETISLKLSHWNSLLIKDLVKHKVVSEKKHYIYPSY